MTRITKILKEILKKLMVVVGAVMVVITLEELLQKKKLVSKEVLGRKRKERERIRIK